jgi:PTH1 family peptidyl-tRNA hydrolase
MSRPGSAASPHRGPVKGPSGASSELPIRAIVGLGNPGKQYAATRHNVGFMAIERLAERLGVSWSGKFNGNYARGRMRGEGGDVDVALLEPLQFMNLSGHPTQAMLQFFGLKPQEVLVLHDELDLPFGRLQLKFGGGHGGHNGLRSLVAQLGTAEFARLRIGISRPPASAGQAAVSDWVLAPFAGVDRAELPDVLARAVQAAEAAVAVGVRSAMASVNADPSAKTGGVAKGSQTP